MTCIKRSPRSQNYFCEQEGNSNVVKKVSVLQWMVLKGKQMTFEIFTKWKRCSPLLHKKIRDIIILAYSNYKNLCTHVAKYQMLRKSPAAIINI